MKRIHVVCAMVVLAAVAGIYYSGSGFKLFEKGDHQSRQNGMSAYYKRMLLFHRRVDNDVPENAVIFLGDSLIQGLAVDAVAPSAINYGISGDTIVGLLHRIQFYTSMQRSQVVVVAIGVNDLPKRSNKEILNNYKKILRAIPDNKPILISKIIPLDEGLTNRSGDNLRIFKLNAAIQEYCDLEARIYCLDISDAVLNSSDNLSEEYHTGDGLHLNAAGTKLWISRLKELYEFMIEAEK